MNRTEERQPFGYGSGFGKFFTRRRGHGRFDITDTLTYFYLLAGVVVMFGPVLWLVMSSFKDETLLFAPKPTFLPYRQARTHVAGYDKELLLYDVTFNQVYIEDAEITIPDLKATNGMVQGIDHVLLTPELKTALAGLDTSGADTSIIPTPTAPVPLEGDQGNVWQVAEAQADLSISVQLIERAGLVDSLTGTDRRTLLAPTNAAFGDFVEAYGEVTVAALLENSDLLRAFLETHILPDQYRVVNLYRSLMEPVPTLAGTTLSLSMVPGETRRLAQVGSPTGAQYTMVDPKDPAAGEMAVLVYSTPLGPSTVLKPVREVYFNYHNYTGAMEAFDFLIYLRNSVIVTIVATIITLIVNSMAAFALSKYAFAGRQAVFLIIIATLMVPISVIMIPAFLVISRVGWVNNLWGLIIPGAATPTGVFLLRQYMLTIPDELLDSARIDGASEWRIYWQIILPLARPAMAVLAIFSIMWRWNDFLWPLIVVSRNELFTLQVGLNAFQGGLDVQWNYILAMTVLTLLPITLVFAFLQRFITSGIATTGMKG
jgi:alpha-1,4-digalacturonate transport system permease protein